jgi:hypothetical protein
MPMCQAVIPTFAYTCAVSGVRYEYLEYAQKPLRQARKGSRETSPLVISIAQFS